MNERQATEPAKARPMTVIAGILLIAVCGCGCASVKQSAAYPASVTISTANHSETGKVVGVGGSMTWNLK